MAVSRPRVIALVVAIPIFCFVALNLVAALRAEHRRSTPLVAVSTIVPEQRQDPIVAGAGGAQVKAPEQENELLDSAGRYTKLVLGAQTTREEKSAIADRVEKRMAAASVVAARLDAAAERAIQLLNGAYKEEREDKSLRQERRLPALEKCSIIDDAEESLCVAPMIQVSRKVRVRLVPKAEVGGRRAFFLLTQGLRQHPAVELVGSSPRFCDDVRYTLDSESPCEKNTSKIGEDHASTADLAIFVMPATDPKFYNSERGPLAYSPYRWGNNREMAQDPIVSIGDTKPGIEHADENPTLFRYAPPVPRSRVVFVDECDFQAPHPHVKPPYLAYFKRSWVRKRDGVPVKAAVGSGRSGVDWTKFFPTPYALLDQYVLSKSQQQMRDLDVVSTLRDARAGRGRVTTWLRERFGESPKVRVGQLSGAGRNVIDDGYLRTMRRAKIVVTCNPTQWEGDFRLFEALASGALVMVDKMSTPYHHPLIDGRHLIYYDHTNQTDLLTKIDHALSHPRWARSVARRGYVHVMRHHRAVSWVDYILRTSLKALGDQSNFTETGQSVLDRVGPMRVSSRRDHGTLASTNADLADDDASPPPFRDAEQPT